MAIAFDGGATSFIDFDGRVAGEGGEESDATRLAVEERAALGLGAVLRKVFAGADLIGFLPLEDEAAGDTLDGPGGAGGLEEGFDPQILIKPHTSISNRHRAERKGISIQERTLATSVTFPPFPPRALPTAFASALSRSRLYAFSSSTCDFAIRLANLVGTRTSGSEADVMALSTCVLGGVAGVGAEKKDEREEVEFAGVVLRRGAVAVG